MQEGDFEKRIRGREFQVATQDNDDLEGGGKFALLGQFEGGEEQMGKKRPTPRREAAREGDLNRPKKDEKGILTENLNHPENGPNLDAPKIDSGQIKL